MKAKIWLIIAVAVVLSFAQEGAAVNSNSKVEDGIEYYVQTDKAVYVLGEEVEMLYKVTNLRDEEVMFGFPHTPVWNFWVEKEGNDVWTAVNRWWAKGLELTLESGESAEFPDVNYPYIWNMRDKEGDLVDVGEYEASGGLDAMSPAYEETKVSVPIRIMCGPVSTDVEIVPHRLNLASRGKWISCHIRLPEGYDVADVNSYSILLEEEIEPDWMWFNEKQNVVMAKFRRSEVEDILEAGEVELTISGELMDGTPFEGMDVITVVEKGRKNK
jgi:hypothetical protein